MGYIKVRNKDNIIFDYQKIDFDELQDYYSVNVNYNFPDIQPYYYYKWDNINNKIILNNDLVSIEFENRKKYSNLRIIKFIDDDTIKHKDFDFTLVLVKSEPLYYKGIKIMQEYLDPDTNEIVVRKYYNEIIGDRNIYGTISHNRILGLKIKIEWLDFDNNVASIKEQQVKIFNREEEGERRLKKRQRQISNLKGLASGTLAENVVDLIYIHYSTVIDYYINQGTSVFYDALTKETDETILYYLNIKLPKSHTFNVNISDFINTDIQNTYIFILKRTYFNYMLNYIELNTNISCYGNLLNYYENDNNTVKYLGKVGEDYKFEINNIIRKDVTLTISWSNTIRDYILHEII